MLDEDGERRGCRYATLRCLAASLFDLSRVFRVVKQTFLECVTSIAKSVFDVWSFCFRSCWLFIATAAVPAFDQTSRYRLVFVRVVTKPALFTRQCADLLARHGHNAQQAASHDDLITWWFGRFDDDLVNCRVDGFHSQSVTSSNLQWRCCDVVVSIDLLSHGSLCVFILGVGPFQGLPPGPGELHGHTRESRRLFFRAGKFSLFVSV